MSDEPRTLTELLPPSELAEFTELSRLHADGWGIAWYDGNRELQVLRSEGAAYQDDEYAEAVAAIATTAAVLHLRWATPGIPVRPGNTHPFVRGGVAFAHNGSIWPRDGLLELLNETPELTGDSDSELYLLALLQRVDKLGFDDGLRATIADVTAELTPSSLNAMLLGDGALTAISCNIGDEGCPGTAGPDAKPEELPGYYDLRYRRLEGATLVASSGWAEASETSGAASWDRMENGTAMVLPAGGGSARTVEVGLYEPAAVARAAQKRLTGEL